MKVVVAFWKHAMTEDIVAFWKHAMTEDIVVFEM